MLRERIPHWLIGHLVAAIFYHWVLYYVQEEQTVILLLESDSNTANVLIKENEGFVCVDRDRALLSIYLDVPGARKLLHVRFHADGASAAFRSFQQDAARRGMLKENCISWPLRGF